MVVEEFSGQSLGGIFGRGSGGGGSLLGGAATTLADGGGAALGGGALSLAAGSSSLASDVFSQSAAALSGSTIPAAAGGASGGMLGKFAFGGYQAVAPMLAGGLALGGIGLMSAGGPIKGALGGAMTGAGVAMGIANLSGSIPALLGLATVPGIGWIMAGIGGIVGLIAGLFSRGKQQKKASALEAQYELTAKSVLDNYNQHQLDYSTALDQLNQVTQAGTEALANSGTGKWGSQAAGALAAAVAIDLSKINAIQKEREARTAALAGMSVPEFAVGGYTGNIPRNGMLAVLHPNEVVQSSDAVNYWGKDFLLALNRAPRFASGGAVGGAVGGGRSVVQNIDLTLNVHAVDGQSVAQFFRSGRGFIIKEVQNALRAGTL